MFIIFQVICFTLYSLYLVYLHILGLWIIDFRVCSYCRILLHVYYCIRIVYYFLRLRLWLFAFCALNNAGEAGNF